MPSVGRYTLLRRIAAGGMAEVWKAKAMGPAGFQKTVAIKKILPHLVSDASFIEMFIEEAKLVAELVHPNIVQVFDFGELGPGDYFLAMEYVPGTNLAGLQRRVKQQGRKIPPEVALFLIAEACKGLAFAHSKRSEDGRPLNLVHRDVSPQNILVSFGGEVKISDFGIAKAASGSARTASGEVRGKIGYMSPEQAKLKPLDGRSDIFSLGIVLYELLTGERLFSAGSSPELYAQVVSFAGPTAEQLQKIPIDLHPILCTVLLPEPDARYRDGLAMEGAINNLLGAASTQEARQALSVLVQKLFAGELQLEHTPIPEAEPPERTQATAPGMGATSASASLPVVVGSTVDPDRETMISPSPARISGLTLASGAVPVQIKPEVKAPPGAAAPQKRSSRLLGISALVAGTLAIGLGAGWLLRPPPQPAATATVEPASTGPVAAVRTTPTPSTPTPTETSTRPSTPVPAHTHHPLATVASASSTPSNPVIASLARQGTLSVRSRPWVAVWVDGKLATEETPLHGFALSAGVHQIRFRNDARHYDAGQQVTIREGAETTIMVDVSKGSIQLE